MIDVDIDGFAGDALELELGKLRVQNPLGKFVLDFFGDFFGGSRISLVDRI